MGKRSGGNATGGARSQSQLAGMLGVSQQQVSKLIRDAEWRWPKRAPWSNQDVREIGVWRQQRRMFNNNPAGVTGVRGEGGDGEDEKILGVTAKAKLKALLARIGKTEAEQKKIDLQVKLLLDKYVLREEIERQNVAKIAAVKSAMLNVGPLLDKLEEAEGLGREDKKAVVLRWCRGICEQFSGPGVGDSRGDVAGPAAA